MRAPNLAGAARRIAVVRALLLLALLGLGARAGHLAVWEPHAKQRAAAQGFTTLRIQPKRGEIFDRSERKLAVTIDAPSVFANGARIEDPARTARALSRVLDIDAKRLRKRIAKARGFVYLARWIPAEQAERVLALELDGIGILPEPKRVDPFGERASQLLGFVNIDGEGVRAVEQQEDAWLRGTGLAYPAERDARGRALASPGVDPRATRGGDVQLTIDLGMQASAEAALRDAIEKTGAHSGIVVSLDPHTGNILALAEAPSFDPNRFREISYRDTRSRAFLDAFEPGSTLKVFLMAGALERGVVDLSDELDCEEGSFRVPGKTIHDMHPHGVLPLTDILRVSSNIGAAKIAYRLGAEPHYETLERFGFGARTGSEFPDESAGLLRHWQRWRPVDHANVAFGQGINTTAIQLAASTAALASDGLWRSPRLVAARRTYGGEWIPAAPAASRRAVSGEAARTVLQMMESVVGPGGTGRMAGLQGVRVAGKTGTAQKFDVEAGSYSNRRTVAWFLGAVPADEPRLVVVVALDEPQGHARTGGAVSAPLFARVAADHLAHYGIFTRPAPAPARAPEPPQEAARPEVKQTAQGGTLGAEDES